MLEPMAQKVADAIVKSVVTCITKKDIKRLSKRAYNFVMLASGFIAHYDHYGFMAVYEDVNDLRADLLRNKSQNQWANFWQGENDYAYMMQKKEIYNRICESIE